MNLEIYNTNFERINIIDSYESMIWTDRYSGYGDFEIYTPMSQELLDIFKKDYYLISDDSEHGMIIEDTRIETDVEKGAYLTVVGRSYESILDRRIIWNQTEITGNLQNGIKKLITQNIISPTKTVRQITNFIFEDSTDETITSIGDIDYQFTGDNLYESIQKLCDIYSIGFKVTLNDDNQFVFKLYAGVNRSYDQDSNPFVVFSPNFDNIINSDYHESYAAYKNVTLVAGEGEDPNRVQTIVGNDTSTELDRRELYTDARDLQSEVDGRQLTPAEYINTLKTRGEEKLQENKVLKEFEGQVEPTQMYRYGEHFFMGDIVQLENEFGLEHKVRVIEFIHSESTNGTEQYPTFEVLDDDEEEV